MRRTRTTGCRGAWRPGLGWVLTAFAAVCLSAAMGATPNEIESWDSGGLDGWKRQDVLNGSDGVLVNSGTFLGIVFANQSMPVPAVDLVYADGGASGGAFVGDYAAARVQSVRFKVYGGEQLPDEVRLYFGNSRNQNRWYYPVSGLKTGEWVTIEIPLEYAGGWRLGTDPAEEKFAEDIQAVAWIGVRFQRDGSGNARLLGLDDFSLVSPAASPDGGLPDWWVQQYFAGSEILAQGGTVEATADSDSDGMNNGAEYLAGTDPTTAESVLAMAAPGGAVGTPGLVVQWSSTENHFYILWRAEDLMAGFSCLESHIPAAPPVNTYNDTTATNAGPYFYKVSVEF